MMAVFDRARRRRRRECEDCGGPLRLETVTLSGAAGRYAVTLQGIPLDACADSDHPRRFKNMEFGERLLDGVFGMEGVTRTSVRWGRTRQRCRACGARIKEPGGRDAQGEDRLAFPDLPPFAVIVEGAQAVCPSCEREHVWGAEEEPSLTDALADALERGRVRP
jgi:hypothetical protein